MLLVILSGCGGEKHENIQPKAMVVLTYDDGLDSQLKYAIPQLDERGLKGTFFLMGCSLDKNKLKAWKEVSDKGHELGNHSVYHPCTSKKENKIYGLDFSLQRYNMKNLRQEAALMDNILTAIDGDTAHYSYAYPCGEYMTIEGENYGQKLIEDGIIKYCRLGTFDDIIEDFDSLDFSRVPTIVAKDDVSVEKLISRINEVIEKKGAAVILFHGVGGDYLTFSADNHRKLLDYLCENSDKVSVKTFSEAMETIDKYRKQ
jgi:sialate O-acetylesterase